MTPPSPLPLLIFSFLLLLLLLPPASAKDNISKVYVVFSNHFDCGYTLNVNGSTSGAVVNEYFHQHFPKAIATADAARRRKQRPDRRMTQSWLVDAFRNCERTKINRGGPSLPSDVICPNATAVAAFEDAIKRGDVGYHAFPFNAEPELFTPELFDTALNMTFAQDADFGHPKRRTLSQRDVPGLTRAAIPLLSKRGVAAVSVGENSQVAPSAVPPIFVSRDNQTQTEVVALFHALGYGGSWPSRRRRRRRMQQQDGPGRIPEPVASDPDNFYVDSLGQVIMRDSADPYDDGPGIHVAADGKTVEGAQRRDEACVDVSAAGVAVCYAWKIDNSGPHSPLQADLLLDAISLMYPKASVVASDAFDDFIADVLPYKASLPVVTAEIGDTW